MPNPEYPTPDSIAENIGHAYAEAIGDTRIAEPMKIFMETLGKTPGITGVRMDLWKPSPRESFPPELLSEYQPKYRLDTRVYTGSKLPIGRAQAGFIEFDRTAVADLDLPLIMVIAAIVRERGVETSKEMTTRLARFYNENPDLMRLDVIGCDLPFPLHIDHPRDAKVYQPYEPNLEVSNN